jgi:hypothetical protein
VTGLSVEEFLPRDAVILSHNDRLAIAAAYNQLFAHGASSGDVDVRDPVTGLTPGRACVAGIVALGGLTSFLAKHYNEHTTNNLYDQIAAIVRSAVESSRYGEGSDDDATGDAR